MKVRKMVKIYIGNLSWGTTDAGLKKAFERFGVVNDANIARDRETGRSRGFGFVKMEGWPARKAIEEMNGSKLDGRVLQVREARPRGDRGRRGGRGDTKPLLRLNFETCDGDVKGDMGDADQVCDLPHRFRR